MSRLGGQDQERHPRWTPCGCRQAVSRESRAPHPRMASTYSQAVSVGEILDHGSGYRALQSRGCPSLIRLALARDPRQRPCYRSQHLDLALGGGPSCSSQCHFPNLILCRGLSTLSWCALPGHPSSDRASVDRWFLVDRTFTEEAGFAHVHLVPLIFHLGDDP